MWIRPRTPTNNQHEFFCWEAPMAGDRNQKIKRTRLKTDAEPRRPGKKAQRPRSEELSPEQRVELAREAAAKQFRGRPPSI
jgi:hypothetical protein